MRSTAPLRYGALALAGVLLAGCVPPQDPYAPAGGSVYGSPVQVQPRVYRTADGRVFRTAAEHDAYLRQQAAYERELYELELERRRLEAGSLSAQQRQRRLLRLERLEREQARLEQERRKAERAQRRAERRARIEEDALRRKEARLERERQQRRADRRARQQQAEIEARNRELEAERARRAAQRAEREAARAAQERDILLGGGTRAQREAGRRQSRIEYLQDRVNRGVAEEYEIQELNRLTGRQDTE